MRLQDNIQMMEMWSDMVRTRQLPEIVEMKALLKISKTSRKAWITNEEINQMNLVACIIASTKDWRSQKWRKFMSTSQ